MILDEQSYGPYAVARGNESSEFLTLRNLTWTTQLYSIHLNEEIGVSSTETKILVRQFHPTEKILGSYAFNDTLKVRFIHLDRV